MRMKAQLENLFCRPKVWLQFWKLGCSLGGRKQWTFLFIERWKNKYAKKCLFLTGSKTPSYFCLFSLRAWEHSTNVNWRCFIVPCVVLEVSDHGQQVLAHLPAMQRTMRPLSAHVLWHGGDGNWMFALHSQGCGGEAWAPDERERERDLSSWRDRCARWLAEASPSDYRRGTVSPDWERTGISLFLLFSHFSRVRLSVTPWTVAHQAPLSIGLPRQEY